MTLRDRIRELANKRGMSLTTLEEALGFGNGTIVRWDKSSPTAEKLSKVADYLGVSADYLLGRDTNEEVNDENIIILNRAAKKMSPENRKKLLDMARLMFHEDFDE